jgi:hypothetical protein
MNTPLAKEYDRQPYATEGWMYAAMTRLMLARIKISIRFMPSRLSGIVWSENRQTGH